MKVLYKTSIRYKNLEHGDVIENDNGYKFVYLQLHPAPRLLGLKSGSLLIPNDYRRESFTYVGKLKDFNLGRVDIGDIKTP